MKRGNRRPDGRGAGSNKFPVATADSEGPCSGYFSTTLRQLHRRREASERMVPLDCGCGPDPWLCRCTQPPLSERALDGYRAAARHVLDAGMVPVLPIEVRRALWRRGGDDRRLAELLHQLCGGMPT